VSSSGAKRAADVREGTIFATDQRSAGGAAQLISGLILARYNAIGGPAATSGARSDEFGLDGRLHQDSKALHRLAAGDAVATDHGAARKPSVNASPASTVVAGPAAAFRHRIHRWSDVTGLSHRSAGFCGHAPADPTSGETFVRYRASKMRSWFMRLDASGVTADVSYAVKSLTESKLRLVKTQETPRRGAGRAAGAEAEVQLQDENGTPVLGSGDVRASPGRNSFRRPPGRAGPPTAGCPVHRMGREMSARPAKPRTVTADPKTGVHSRPAMHLRSAPAARRRRRLGSPWVLTSGASIRQRLDGIGTVPP